MALQVGMDILDAARANYRRAKAYPYPAAFALSERWSHWATMAANAIDGFSAPTEAIWFAQQKLGFEHRHSVEGSAHRWSLYEKALLDDFPDRAAELQHLHESHLSSPVTVKWFQGRPMSNMLFWHAYEYLSTSRAVPSPRRIVEIGGGYGSLARLWWENSSTLESYWMTDFPEALFFAEVYLRSHFPGLKVHYWSTGDKLEDVEKAAPNLVFFPAQCANEITGLSGDLLVNSGSMQEMPETAIIYWSKWIEEAAISNFWACNYFLQPIEQTRGGSANWMCPRVSRDWHCVSTRLDPPIVRTQTLRHFREVIYRRADLRKVSGEQQQFLADQILAGHQHRVDLTDAAGILALFEAVRLSSKPAACLRLIEVLGNFTDYRPKELVYLCNLALQKFDLDEAAQNTVKATLRSVQGIANEEHRSAVPTAPLF